MYAAYFHLKELPFSIAPNPAYLYLSARHQEALGHLLYGTGQYGGFVQLTGEVGTGKTTIIRTLLAQKLPNLDVAMIHNPRQSEQEFVQSICDELHIQYPSENCTLKVLVDALNRFLLTQFENGRRTVLIIDEAQQLSPDVLEQVRLLTNLETEKEKLLRIMLIGQPELSELLARQELRQLAQRITARYHLLPLAADEVQEYIAHRLQVAGGARDLFSVAAMKAVFQHSQGIPRLINVICDRALLGAYAHSVTQVSPSLVHMAAAEVFGEKPAEQIKSRITWPTLRMPRLSLPRMDGAWLRGLEVGLIAIAILGSGFLLWRHLDRKPSTGPAVVAPKNIQTKLAHPPGEMPEALASRDSTDNPPPAAVKIPAPSAATPPAASTEPPVVNPVIARLETASAAPNVLAQRLGRLWQPSVRFSSREPACRSLHRQQLECLKSSGDWNALRELDTPAVLTLSLGKGKVQSVLLRKLGKTRALLSTSNGDRILRLAELDPFWTGEYLVLWQRETDASQITPETVGDPIIWLRTRVADRLGFELSDNSSPTWDAELEAMIKRYQVKKRLRVDGRGNPRTLASLSQKRADLSLGMSE